MIRLIIIALLLLQITACSAQQTAPPSATAVPTAAPTQIPLGATAVPTAAPTQTPHVSALTQPQSAWAGAIIYADGTAEAILVQLDTTGGTLTIQPKTAALTLAKVERTEATLAFNVTTKTTLEFTGQLKGLQIVGQVEGGNQSGSFVLWPLLTQTDTVRAEFSGTYQFTAGESLRIHLPFSFAAAGLDFFWSGLTLTHFGTGAVRGLYPIAQDMFLVGSARVIGYPFEAQVTFTRDASGRVSGLTWQTFNPTTRELGDIQLAQRLALPEETVPYPSADGITLTGLLTLPPTPGPHPAIVVLHGSERGERNDFFRQQLSAFMASHGIAVLTYDKRGVGDSGGIYQEAASEANLSLLAQDALAGVSYLKRRPEIDSQHIGLIGSSQSGWSVPLAAAQSGDIDFFVILSGAIVSVGIEDAYSSYTNDGESSPRYSGAEISQKLAGVQPSGFDPVPTIAKLRQPGLWLWGDQDKSIPVPESLKKLDSLIAQGQSRLAYHLFPNADHNLQQSKQGLFNEIPYSSGYPEDFFRTLAMWLKATLQKPATA